MYQKEYSELLRHPKWFERRKTIVSRDNNKCQNCGSTDSLVVHHRQYLITIKNNNFLLPWQYGDENLVTLCSHCHKTGHESFKVPVFRI